MEASGDADEGESPWSFESLSEGDGKASHDELSGLQEQQTIEKSNEASRSLGTLPNVSPSPYDVPPDHPSPLTSLKGQPIRPSPQRRIASTSDLPSIPISEQCLSPIVFDPPHRSIFTSGPPTASVSASTAQASISTVLPFGSSRPLTALTSGNDSRRTPRSTELPFQVSSLLSPSRQGLMVPEKYIDDPSTTAIGPGAETDMDTSAALSKLFATASPSATPMSISRGQSHQRGLSAPGIEDSSTLQGHLLHRGFMDGRHSDITIHAFGHSYRLHKLLLDRVPFFASAFSGSWAESSAQAMTLHPEDIDTYISRTAFELALKRVYGTHSPVQEEREAVHLFATACWLDMPDLVDVSVDSILRQMHPSKLDVLIKLVTSNYYGKNGDRILNSAKAMLCREGYEMPYRFWNRIPAEIIREIVGGNPFYVPGEWERWYLALKLLNRRLKQKAIQAGLVSPSGRYIYPRPSTLKFSAVRFDKNYRKDTSFESGRQIAEKDEPWLALYASPDISPLLVLLDEGIHYVHMRFEQLQQMKTQKDILGVPVLPEKIISDALWMSMELRQRVINACETDLELGLSEIAENHSQSTKPAVTPNEDKGKTREDHAEEFNENENSNCDSNGKPRKFWIPGTDVSYVTGGSREASLAANLAGSAEWTSYTNRISTSMEPSDVTWAADFTGLVPEYPSHLSRNADSRQPPRYSHYPPFRFSAEFPNPRTLKEKKRVYSQTVWYAGSMWNLYCQRVNTSKTQQLGIYLHRAKDKDPSDDPLAQFIPATVDDRIGQLEREMLMRKSERRNRHGRGEVLASGGEADHEDDLSGSGPDEDGPSLTRTDSRVHKASQTPSLTSPTGNSTANAIACECMTSSEDENEDCSGPGRRFNVPALPPYVDGRPTIKTYFKIYSPSKAGRMLSIYESAPDRFNFSQSWGWKSSQMVLDDGVSGAVDIGGRSAKDGKLRYMVVIGNV